MESLNPKFALYGSTNRSSSPVFFPLSKVSAQAVSLGCRTLSARLAKCRHRLPLASRQFSRGRRTTSPHILAAGKTYCGFNSFLVWLGFGSRLTSHHLVCPISLILADTKVPQHTINIAYKSPLNLLTYRQTDNTQTEIN